MDIIEEGNWQGASSLEVSLGFSDLSEDCGTLPLISGRIRERKDVPASAQTPTFLCPDRKILT